MSNMRFLNSKNSCRRLYLNLSTILSMLESRDIGWSFEHLSLDTFSKLGWEWPKDRIEGKTQSENKRLNSSDNWFEISFLSNFKVFVGILRVNSFSKIKRQNNILNICFITWLYEKRINVYISKEIIKICF